LNKLFLPLAGAVSVALITVSLVLAFTQSPSPSQPAAAASPAAGAVLKAATVAPASLVQVPSFGANPGHLAMFVYVPRSLRPDPGILLALHWSCATGQDFFLGTGYSTTADEYGFIVIYPTGDCWDTSSQQALRRGGGSDPVSLMSMITYTEREYHADPHRVYVTGASAGGMMTATMLGDYPDVFAAGSVMEGVPFACPQACAQAPASEDPVVWGDLVRKADAGYHGPRPRVQIWQGTADQNVLYPNLAEEIKQWTNVADVSLTPVATEHPQPGWTLTDYGTGKDSVAVQAYRLAGVGHDLPEVGMEADVISFFGLDRAT
jgi:poly(hydroxyalkanoate) depolymerase family esterase